MAIEIEKKCAHEGCENEVTEDDYCPGCNDYICEEHSRNLSLMGRHVPEDHWEDICDGCGEHVDCCHCNDE